MIVNVKNQINEIIEDKEYLEDVTKYIQESGFVVVDSSKMMDCDVHNKPVVPYIKVLSGTIEQCFNDLTTKMCYATSIFDPKKIKDER